LVVQDQVVILGGSLTYTLTVTNNGPDSASGVTVVDTLPAGVTFQSAPSGCAEQSGIVSCALGSIDPGVQKVLEIIVTVNTTSELQNDAAVSGNEFDSLVSNNTYTSRSQVGSNPADPGAGTGSDPVPPIVITSAGGTGNPRASGGGGVVELPLVLALILATLASARAYTTHT
jgi:uncharacterized repeat protein (TIGR01451 family)